jgi:hypothetical protein
MPSDLMREFNVEGLSPRSCAAPSLPATRHSQFSNAREMF